MDITQKLKDEQAKLAAIVDKRKTAKEGQIRQETTKAVERTFGDLCSEVGLPLKFCFEAKESELGAKSHNSYFEIAAGLLIGVRLSETTLTLYLYSLDNVLIDEATVSRSNSEETVIENRTALLKMIQRANEYLQKYERKQERLHKKELEQAEWKAIAEKAYVTYQNQLTTAKTKCKAKNLEIEERWQELKEISLKLLVCEAIEDFSLAEPIILYQWEWQKGFDTDQLPDYMLTYSFDQQIDSDGFVHCLNPVEDIVRVKPPEGIPRTITEIKISSKQDIPAAIITSTRNTAVGCQIACKAEAYVEKSDYSKSHFVDYAVKNQQLLVPKIAYTHAFNVGNPQRMTQVNLPLDFNKDNSRYRNAIYCWTEPSTTLETRFVLPASLVQAIRSKI